MKRSDNWITCVDYIPALLLYPIRGWNRKLFTHDGITASANDNTERRKKKFSFEMIEFSITRLSFILVVVVEWFIFNNKESR